jgi:hypothetical protein
MSWLRQLRVDGACDRYLMPDALSYLRHATPASAIAGHRSRHGAGRLIKQM